MPRPVHVTVAMDAKARHVTMAWRTIPRAGESCALLAQEVLAYVNQDTQENTELLDLFLSIIIVEMDHSFIFFSFVQFLWADVVEITIDISSVFKG
jgi:hypothetical protein